FQALDWGDDPNYCWFVDAGVSLSRGSGEGGGSIPAQLGDYPILNPTTDQPDPGLPHTTPVSTLEDLENM
ncbi:MAG: hypothetical protein GWN13_09855, partial [Phycisphaerae bacterium]|nr:hypothetical protein [Phycisphaerae bacterium]